MNSRKPFGSTPAYPRVGSRRSEYPAREYTSPWAAVNHLVRETFTEDGLAAMRHLTVSWDVEALPRPEDPVKTFLSWSSTARSESRGTRRLFYLEADAGRGVFARVSGEQWFAP